MAFEKPLLEDLFALAANLEKSYTGNNSQRLSFIAKLKQITAKARKLSPKQASELILTQVAIELDLIECGEYFSWGRPDRSEMYSLLKKFLKITPKNQFSAFERLPYLNKGRDYLQIVYNDQDFADLKSTMAAHHQTICWENKDAMVAEVDGVKKAHLIRFEELLRQLENSTEELEALRGFMNDLPALYLNDVAEKNAAAWVRTYQPRPHMVPLIELMHEAGLHLYTRNPDDELDEAREQETKARYAFIFYIVVSIESSAYLTNGSSLCKRCIDFLDANKIAHYSADTGAKLLDNAMSAISRVLRSKRFLKDKSLEWREKNFGNLEEILNKFQVEMHTLKLKQQERANQASLAGMAISTGVGYGAQTLGKKLCTSAAVYALKNGLRLAVGTTSATSAGMAITTTASLLVFGLGYASRKTIVGKIIMSGLKAGGEIVTGSLGDRASDLINHFNAAQQTLFSLREKFTREEDGIFCNWVNALVEQPDSLISSERKQKFRSRVGIKEGEKLQPLPLLVPRLAFMNEVSKVPIAIAEYDPEAAKDAVEAALEKLAETVTPARSTPEQTGLKLS